VKPQSAFHIPLPALLASLLLAWLAASLPASAAEPSTLPHERDAKFLGVETCGSSQCHGSAEPWRNATVLMKERLIWQAHDPHAKAYASLAGEAGKNIATRLGLPDATQADECLVCHATQVPIAQRGPQFTLEAGVGCESCHGPGGSFLATHVQVTSQHASNIEAGMYPTTDPAARAALCLSCHQGDQVRKISHRLYGAGHPRLRFELDTYGVLQPYHFNPDADYRRRKPLASHFRLWAEGQLKAAHNLLALTDPTTAHARAGLFPELAQFDCHACHQAINDDPDYRPRAGLPAGMPTRNDAPLVVLRALAQLVDPASVPDLTTATRDWQKALTASTQTQGAADLQRAVNSLAAAFATRAETPGDGRAVAQALLVQAKTEAPLPFMAAESVAMSLSTLVTADFEAGRLTPSQFQQLNEALNAVYAAVGNERTYRATTYASALESVAAVMGQQ
jgi:hypothetical protein